VGLALGVGLYTCGCAEERAARTPTLRVDLAEGELKTRDNRHTRSRATGQLYGRGCDDQRHSSQSAGFRDWVARNAVFFRAFAAGTLVTVSFLHLIPESQRTEQCWPVQHIGWRALGGCTWSTGFLRLRLHHINSDLQRYNPGIIPALGIGLHSFIDGIIYTVTFNVSLFTGLLAAVGMVLARIPRRDRGVRDPATRRVPAEKGRAGTPSWLAALSTPLGTLLSFPFINQSGHKSVLGALLADERRGC
jgi:zinc and cadmium transporter